MLITTTLSYVDFTSDGASISHTVLIATTVVVLLSVILATLAILIIILIYSTKRMKKKCKFSKLQHVDV